MPSPHQAQEQGCCGRVHTQCEVLASRVQSLLFGHREVESDSERVPLSRSFDSNSSLLLSGQHVCSSSLASTKEHNGASWSDRHQLDDSFISDLAIAIDNSHERDDTTTRGGHAHRHRKHPSPRVNGSGTRVVSADGISSPRGRMSGNREQHPRGSAPLQERHTMGFIPRENALDIQLPLPFRNKYKLGGLVGIGTSSKCYLATRRSDGCEFACKIIDTRKLAMTHPAGVVEQFKSEISTLELLDHPNIIKLHDHYNMPNQIFIVLELVRGGELFDRIVRENGLSERDAKHVFRSVCNALEYMHSLDVMHRDVKPENMLLVSNHSSDVKIIDFGFSKVMSDGQYAKSFMGTGGFLAPELRHSSAYTKAVDMWSAGVTLYVMLSGNLPFDIGVERHARRASQYNLKFPVKQWSRISRQAKEVVSKLLTADPDQRMTAKEAMRHPWLSSAAADHPHNHFGYHRHSSDSVSSAVSAGANSILGLLRKATSNFNGTSTNSSQTDIPGARLGACVVAESGVIAEGPEQQSRRSDEKSIRPGSEKKVHSKSRQPIHQSPGSAASSSRTSGQSTSLSGNDGEEQSYDSYVAGDENHSDSSESVLANGLVDDPCDDDHGATDESNGSFNGYVNGSIGVSLASSDSFDEGTSNATTCSGGSFSSTESHSNEAPPTPYRGPVGRRTGMLLSGDNTVLFRSRSMPCLAMRSLDDNNTSPPSPVMHSPVVTHSHSVHGGKLFGDGRGRKSKNGTFEPLFRRVNLASGSTDVNESVAMLPGLYGKLGAKTGGSFLLSAAMIDAARNGGGDGETSVSGGKLFGSASSWLDVVELPAAALLQSTAGDA
jgi:serine/threonine protein kinase